MNKYVIVLQEALSMFDVFDHTHANWIEQHILTFIRYYNLGGKNITRCLYQASEGVFILIPIFHLSFA
jgi:hypothetical protein